jgi:hypothetical protein
MKLKFMDIKSSVRVTGLNKMYLDSMQQDGKCDTCNKPLPTGTRVIAKILKTNEKGTDGTTFSPTCLACADIN